MSTFPALNPPSLAVLSHCTYLSLAGGSRSWDNCPRRIRPLNLKLLGNGWTDFTIIHGNGTAWLCCCDTNSLQGFGPWISTQLQCLRITSSFSKTVCSHICFSRDLLVNATLLFSAGLFLWRVLRFSLCLRGFSLGTFSVFLAQSKDVQIRVRLIGDYIDSWCKCKWLFVSDVALWYPGAMSRLNAASRPVSAAISYTSPPRPSKAKQ